MKRILVVQGPNLNLLGEREPHLYGRETLASLHERLAETAGSRGYEAEFFQSNHEGALIDCIHEARRRVAGALINPGGLTHTSVALRDAILSVTYPFVEVHLSNLFTRESFRQVDLVAPACKGLVMGFGTDGYIAALYSLIALLETNRRKSNAARPKPAPARAARRPARGGAAKERRHAGR